MTKQDVIKVMTGQMPILQFFSLYCIDFGHTPARVAQLVEALQHTQNVDFVNNLMQHALKKSQDRFEIVILTDPKKPNYFQIL